MGTLRLPESVWEAVRVHLFGQPGEHFAFLLAGWTYSLGSPVFMVRDAILISDDQVGDGWDGLEVNLEAILGAINAAVRSGACLIEAHNHGGVRPRFSTIDRKGLPGFARYALESLPGRPYAATVWGDSTIYGEYFLSDGSTGWLSSITVIGRQLRPIVSRDDDGAAPEPTFDRQLPWFTAEGQRQLGRLRVTVVGGGGTGSHVIQNLAFLGCRDVVLIDHDNADETSCNRVVTAAAADVGTPKVILGRRLIKAVAPNARVLALNTALQSANALDSLKGVDVIFGCVDNDGARLILNELALAYGIPYFDLAVGLDAEVGRVSAAGGRVAVVLPGGPCLYCLGQIDPAEAGYFLASPTEQAVQRARGYVTGMDVPAPSVVSMNALVAAAAINEFAVFISGLRPVNPLSEYDLLGCGHGQTSQWLVPTTCRCSPGCVQCACTGLGDRANIERYASSAP